MQAQPADSLLQHYLGALASASRARDFERALSIGEEATRRGVEHPNLLGLAAQKHMRGGDAGAAYPLLARARELDPGNAEVLNDLGLCLVRLGRAREALAVLDAALVCRPGAPRALFNQALACEQLGELDRMRDRLERTIAAEPGHYRALGLLAMLAVDRGDAAAARDHAGKALALSPDDVPAKIALAAADVASGEFAAARDGLAALLADPGLDPDNRAIALTLAGDASDGEERYDDALRFYTQASRTQQARHAQAFRNPARETFAARCVRIAHALERLPAEKARAPRTRDAPAPVFLIGFMRSGTTLLGQILAGHSAVEVMHERDGFEAAARDFLVPPDGLQRLAEASDAALEGYRRSYWQTAKTWGHGAARAVFVDKSPLAAPCLPLIARLFPGAKILFALRDPRDVVLSCFRRRFAMSAQSYELLAPEGVAAAYDGAMRLSERCRERLGLEFRDVRHEALLADAEGEVLRICGFLGIGFEPAMLDFAPRARAANINAAGSAELARGFTRGNAGHWRRYADALRPVMPVLAPWCARFGYGEN